LEGNIVYRDELIKITTRVAGGHKAQANGITGVGIQVDNSFFPSGIGVGLLLSALRKHLGVGSAKVIGDGHPQIARSATVHMIPKPGFRVGYGV
jgi:hypothetical protein